MTKISLHSWLEHIQNFHPDEIEMGLERIRLVAKKLKLLEVECPVITVGGTNGKGSCVATLEAIAKSQGVKVASYTSPHLMAFNERIKINGDAVNDQILVDAFTAIEKVRQDVTLTFFEFTTLAALWIFKQSPVELIILEVGLGGRLDAVNIIEPDVALITTIALDHTDWLGHTLEEVAFEKAGIIRDEKMAFVGDEKSYQLLKQLPQIKSSNLSLAVSADKKACQLINNHAVNRYCLLEQNIMLSLTAFQYLYHHKVVSLKQVFQHLKIEGRFQLLNTHIPTIVDVAHNIQAAENLKKQLKTYQQQNSVGRIYAICGMMADKLIDEVLMHLDEVVDSWHFVNLPVNRAILAEELRLRYLKLNSHKVCHAYDSVAKAYDVCVADLTKEDLILVFGSFITVMNMIQYKTVIINHSFK